jgi:hypothetical protein
MKPAGDKDNQNLVMSLDEFIATSYVPFCDDFGPMNLGTVHEFCELLLDRVNHRHDRSIIIQTTTETRFLTNAIFLLVPSW